MAKIQKRIIEENLKRLLWIHIKDLDSHSARESNKGDLWKWNTPSMNEFIAFGYAILKTFHNIDFTIPNALQHFSSKSCPQCGKIEYNVQCKYCNESRYLPDDDFGQDFVKS